MNVVFALVVLYASIAALAGRRPRRGSSGVVVDEAAPRRWLRLALRAIGSTAVAAALALGFSDGASAQAVDTAAAESVVVVDSAVEPTDAPAAADHLPSTAADAPPATTPPAAAATSPATDPTAATTGPPTTDPAAGVPTTTLASGDTITAGDATAASAPPAADATLPAALPAAAPTTDPTGDAAEAAIGPADPAPAAGDPIAAVAAAAVVAAAPGTPGTPQPPTVIFTEDFQNRPGPTPIVELAGYTGATGQTYTAALEWLALCNGWISSASQPPDAAAPIADCDGGTGQGQLFWNESQQLSQALAMALGQSAADAQANFAVSAFTTNNPGPGLTEFQTATNIALMTPNRFLTFSVDVSTVNCNQTHPLLQFFLLDGSGGATPVGTQIDPCTSTGTVDVNVPAIGAMGPTVVRVGTYTTNDPVLISGGSVGVRLVNAQGSGAGNDLAFDNIKIFDVTPQLDKSFSSASVGVGQTSTLTLTVTNTNDLAAKNGWSFVDNLPAGLTVAAAATTTCPAGIVTALIGGSTISVGGNLNAGTVSCTVTVQVTSSTTGSFTNSNFSSVVGMSLPNPATVTFTSEPALTIVKSSTTVTIPLVGQTIPYSFVVTNTGNVQMTGIAVTDPKTAGVSCLVTTLAPNQSTTCAGTHTVVQADLDAGSVVNTASVVGTPPVGTAIPPVPSNQVTIPGLRSPALTIVKSSITTSATAVGQVIPYTFLVTNTGNVTITGVAVSDPKLGTVTCPATPLAPGSSATCTGSYTVTVGDLDSGQPIRNTATVTGTPPPGAPPLPPPSASTVSIPVAQSPALTIVKASTTISVTAVGQVIPYTFLVTNTGNVTITGVAVSDSKLGAVTCPVRTLAPGISTTCTGSYTATLGDLDNGQRIVNTATVTGTPPPNAPALPPPPASTVTIVVVQSPALTIVIASTTTSVTAVGQVIPYTFLVTNTGNVTITGGAVSDRRVGAVTCPVTTLAPGSSALCTGTYTVTAGDLDSGQPIVNTATVTGTPPLNAPALSPSSANTVTVAVVQSPALTIVKSSTTTSATTVGQVIPYTFLVTNTGNVTMTSVAVNDAKVGNVTCPQTSIAASASMTCTASYTVTEADVTAGQVVNTASVVGTPPSGTPITAVVSNEAVIAIAPLPPTTTMPDLGDLAPVLVASPAAPTALLPTTGGNAESMLRIAIVLAGLGAGLIVVSRRRKRFVS